MTQIELLKQQTTTTNEGAHSTLDSFLALHLATQCSIPGVPKKNLLMLPRLIDGAAA